MSDSDNSFNVVDKRGFEADGSLKTETTQAPEQPKESPKEQNAQQAAPKHEYQPVDFVSFIVSFATQAIILMGEAPNPQTGLTVKDIDGARQTIDVLTMLREKTKGNLTSDEEKLYEDILANLHIAFLKASK